jgi:hypothetical protein
MTPFGEFLLRLARKIAGADRAEWVDAMAAETQSIHGDSTLWTVGCLSATCKERLWRERWFLAAVIGFPILVFVFRLLLFFPVVFAGRALGLPNWTFIAVFICLELPFGFALARLMPWRRAIITALLCGVLLELAGIVQFWISFGDGPEIWFRPGSQIYNMTPVLGWAIGISTWLAGAAIGAVTRSKAPPAEA